MSDQVDEIKAKSDIVSVISDYITLKKAGKNFKALCPFHSEKTPSFVVSPEIQHFKCFGCGESGDAISFLEKYEGMDFYEALKFLADRAGVQLKPLQSGQQGVKDKLYRVNSLTTAFYHYVLTSHRVGKKALDYLLRRGLKISTIRTFKLGYSPDEPFAIRKYLIEKKKFIQKDLESAGLIYTKDGKTYDRFRGRVIFPLSDHRSNVGGFAGRILPDKEKLNLAKYINTPETDIYHKSKILYGLESTKKDIKKSGSVVVVEGELDMISSWQAGIKNVVAIKGSALTEDQVGLLSRFANEIILALDADVAGDSAAKRGIEIAERQGFDMRVVRLGKYKDPDEAARQNPDYLKKAVQNAVGVWDFVIDLIFAKNTDKTGIAKAKISREVVPILSRISDKIVQSYYIQEVARRLGVNPEAVAEQISFRKPTEDNKEASNVVIIPSEEKKGRRELLEDRLMSVAFRYDPKVLLNRQTQALVKTPLTRKILDEFTLFMDKNKEFDPSIFASKLPDELVSGFTDMVLKDIRGLADKPETYEKEIELIVRQLQSVQIKEELKKSALKIKDLELKKETGKLLKTQEKYNILTNKLHDLENPDLDTKKH